jgi:hypothetical protein
MSDEHTRKIKSEPDLDDQKTRLLKPNEAGGKRRLVEVDDAPDVPKTRVMRGVSAHSDVIDAAADDLVVGWLVVVSGPGRGGTREIHYGMNGAGRDPEERIPLDFGDEAISRNAHFFIVYDEKQRDYYIQHGGKSNLVRLNGKPVLMPQEMKHGDRIAVGDTELMFVPLCSSKFNWEDTEV